MPARTAYTSNPAPLDPEIVEAANFATDLVNRTLKLVAQGIAAEEQSPTPDLKKCAGYIATIKRAADALKALAPLRAVSDQPVTAPMPLNAPTASPKSSSPDLPAETTVPAPIIPTLPLSSGTPEPTATAPIPSTPGRSLASSLAGLAKMRGKSLRAPASTRSYGEHLSRR